MASHKHLYGEKRGFKERRDVKWGFWKNPKSHTFWVEGKKKRAISCWKKKKEIGVWETWLYYLFHNFISFQIKWFLLKVKKYLVLCGLLKIKKITIIVSINLNYLLFIHRLIYNLIFLWFFHFTIILSWTK